MTTPTATRDLRPGDLVAFRFPYAEGVSPYARPCLVLEATREEVLLAYGTTSRGRANQGMEIRLNRDFAACGLLRPTRFVTARRVRVLRSDPRFEPDPETGTLPLGRLPGVLMARLATLRDSLAENYATLELRYQAERAGLHPPKGGHRRGGWRCRTPTGPGGARPAGDHAAWPERWRQSCTRSAGSAM